MRDNAVLSRGCKSCASLLLGWMLVIFLLAACGSSDPAVTPNASAVQQSAVWDYVALGDARTADADWPDLYAVHVETDLGVEVRVHNWASVNQTSEALLDSLRENESLRQIVARAEIVTLWTGGTSPRTR